MIGRGMMQRLVDTVLGIAKESIKTISQESFNTTVRLINGFSALVLAVLPAKSSLEGIQGWELHPTLRGPRLPQWMEEGVSSFNSFIHDYDSDSDAESEAESEYESGLDDDCLPPSSPCSQTSHISRVSSGGRCQRKHSSIWKRTIRKLFWPVRIWSSGGQPPSTPRGSLRGSHGILRERSGSGSFNRMYSIASRRLSGVKDYMMPKQTGDRRRGIVEDLQLSMELFIERTFEVVRNFIYYLLSPFETFKVLFRWVWFNDPYQDSGEEVVDTATLGDSDATPQKQLKQGQSLNTDGRTCEDVITSLGYPYEALRVTTADGHILLLERIPRRNSQKVLYLQHGLMDSSLGWVSSGVVGSQAFAAYDQGYDVFLGNFRGLASREHVNKHISSQRYWQYSVNEHGTQDIPAMLVKIHEIKMFDLRDIQDDLGSSNPVNCQGERLPYSLCGVAHSLGGASILMYVVTRRLENKPHYLSRLILLSPAGFHEDAPAFCAILQYVIPIVAPIIRPFAPGLYIRTRFFRGLFNKLARDFQNYPAVGGLVQTLVSYLVGGDSSNWVGAIGMSHYNMNDMPGVSLQVAEHLAQMMRVRKFRMFDFGSARANLEAYGTREPLDIGAYYGAIDIPVDVVAGLKDRLIPRSMVRRHYQTLKEGGCKASYDEFEYAHLDFTFSHKEELLAYIMSRLLLVTEPRLQNGDLRSFKSRNIKKSNGPPSKKSLKKPKIFIDGEVEDKKVISELLQNGHQTGSRKAEKSRQLVQESELTDETSPYALTSTSQSEVESIHNHILRTVSAGSVATPSHEESGTDSHLFEPESFDDSSLFAFPSRDVVSIISKRASMGGKRGVDATRISESDISRGFEIRSSADRVRSIGRLPPTTIKDASRISAFSKLRNKFFGSSLNRSEQLSNYGRSYTQ